MVKANSTEVELTSSGAIRAVRRQRTPRPVTHREVEVPMNRDRVFYRLDDGDRQNARPPNKPDRCKNNRSCSAYPDLKLFWGEARDEVRVSLALSIAFMMRTCDFAFIRYGATCSIQDESEMSGHAAPSAYSCGQPCCQNVGPGDTRPSRICLPGAVSQALFRRRQTGDNRIFPC